MRSHLRRKQLIWTAAICTLATSELAQAGGVFSVVMATGTGSGSLYAAIQQADAAGNGSSVYFADDLGMIDVGQLPDITVGMTIEGDAGNTLSGQNLNRIFFVNAPGQSVTISDLTLTAGRAQGGAGNSGGGGGAGLGGAVFINAGAVNFSSVAFTGNAAAGGNGAPHGAGAGGGGGGLEFAGGTGGASGIFLGGGGGGGARSSAGQPGTATAAGNGGGANGGLGGPGDGTNAGYPATGTADGGGGGGALDTSAYGGLGGGAGGNGNDFGGGAGGGGSLNNSAGNGGNGGFGAGGGGGGDAYGAPAPYNQSQGGNGGAGGFGGGGGGAGGSPDEQYTGPALGGAHGYGGGAGGQGNEGGGGGGAAFGAAVFVRSANGASVSFTDSTTDAGSLTAGLAGGAAVGGSGSSGSTDGSALFLMGGSTTFTVSSANSTQTIAGSIGQSSSSSVIKAGPGTLVFSAASDYSGGTAVNAGTLKLTGIALPASTAGIAANAVLDYDPASELFQPTMTYTGAGTLRLDGTSTLVFGGEGNVNLNFSPGALVDLEGGTLDGSSSFQGIWTSNQASMNIAANATFDAVEAGPSDTIQIDALTGAGLFEGGYQSSGNGGFTTVTLGVAGGGGTFSGTLQNDTGAKLVVVKTGTGTETLTGKNTYTGGTTVQAGKLVIGAAAALPDAAVAVTSTGDLQLAPGIGAVTIQSLFISGSGKFDLENNHLFINYGSGPDPIASVASWLASGYAGGAWNGAGGIDTSAPLVVGGLTYGLGYADGDDSQAAVTGLASGNIEIKYTLLGDADLSGIVNGIDFGILAANFNKGVTGWDEGDFDYNNIVNGVDFGDLAANFNKGAAGAAATTALDAFAAANGLLADVPEPTSSALLAIAAVSFLPRRRASLLNRT